MLKLRFAKRVWFLAISLAGCLTPLVLRDCIAQQAKPTEIDNWLKGGEREFSAGKFDQALALFTKALLAARMGGNLRLEGVSQNDLGATYQALGRIPQARNAFSDALRIHRQTGDKQEQSNTIFNLGRLFLDQGQFKDAQQLMEQALPICRALGDRVGEAYALNNLGFSLANQGHARLGARPRITCPTHR